MLTIIFLSTIILKCTTAIELRSLRLRAIPRTFPLNYRVREVTSASTCVTCVSKCLVLLRSLQSDREMFCIKYDSHSTSCTCVTELKYMEGRNQQIDEKPKWCTFGALGTSCKVEDHCLAPGLACRRGKCLPRSIKLPDLPTTKLTDLPTTKPTDPSTTKLTDPPTTKLTDPPTTKLTDPQTTKLTDPPTTKEPNEGRKQEAKAKKTSGQNQQSTENPTRPQKLPKPSKQEEQRSSNPKGGRLSKHVGEGCVVNEDCFSRHSICVKNVCRTEIARKLSSAIYAGIDNKPCNDSSECVGQYAMCLKNVCRTNTFANIWGVLDHKGKGNIVSGCKGDGSEYSEHNWNKDFDNMGRKLSDMSIADCKGECSKKKKKCKAVLYRRSSRSCIILRRFANKVPFPLPTNITLFVKECKN